MIMVRCTNALAFFDIGDTLAPVTIASSGDRIERLTVYEHHWPTDKLINTEYAADTARPGHGGRLDCRHAIRILRLSP
jgi:hypothetical protein